MPLFTCTADVAKRLGVHRSTLTDLARRAGVRASVWPSSSKGRLYKYTEEQILAMQRAKDNPIRAGRHSASHQSTFYRKAS